MGIADNLVGTDVIGQRSGTKWTVTEKVAQTPGNTPGQFSVAYKCEDTSGNQAFLKASDLSKVLGADPNDIVGNILKATTAYNFEQQILEHCSGNAMDRVVTAIDYGSQQSSSGGTIDVLFFLVFELAEGDLRKRVERRAAVDLAWIASALHDFCVAVSQLHSGSVYHNDLKPANALTFGEAGNKVADLGRATTPLIAVAHEHLQCAGDKRFAPPEQLYAPGDVVNGYGKFQLFQAGDLYNLGSLAHYLLTGRSVTIDIIDRLRPEMRPRSLGGGWTDSLENILPYWRTLFVDLLREAADVLPPDWPDKLRPEFDKLVGIVEELCEPDIRRRGHPSLVGRANQFDLQRYISALNLQRAKLLVLQKSAN